MCEKIDEAPLLVDPVSGNKRLKLWELKEHFHCALLGTCLSMEELRKLVRQSGLKIDGRPSDYQLHSIMVGQVENKSRAARLMNKFLDRKYSRWIKRLAKELSNGELKLAWQTAMESGDISGCFWAISTHPNACSDLLIQIYGDVHMLSHLQGASNRADLKRIVALDEEVAELQEILARMRIHHADQMAQRDAVIERREQELQSLRLRVASQPFLEQNRRGSAMPDKGQELLQRRLDWAEDKLVERDMRMAGLREELAGLKELLSEVRDEHAAMEHTITLLLAERNNANQDREIAIDLHGKRILYVGGRATLAPHLRSLVEVHNGVFDHHDGGLEESRASLQHNLAGADMVFCPIDCISHDACLRVKRHCRQQAKQFIPLRSSGISAFADGLRRLARGGEGINAKGLESTTIQ